MDPSLGDWDDLRYLLAVGRAGSLSGAARQLGVNHSTVFRRLGALEARLGVRLFERLPGGYVATAAGEDLLRGAERIESEALELGRRLAGRDLSLSGSLRLTAPDDVAERLLMAPLAGYRRSYPEISLEVVIDNRMLSLTKREADVALRPSARPPEVLVGRRIGPLASALYGTDDMAPETGPWIAWEEGGGPPDVARWVERHVAPERIVYRSNSMLHLLAACRAGVGAALLPCFLADPDPALRRLAPPDPALSTELWLLTHPDLRRSARVRALLDFLFDALKPMRTRLAGEINC